MLITLQNTAYSSYFHIDRIGSIVRENNVYKNLWSDIVIFPDDLCSLERDEIGGSSVVTEEGEGSLLQQGDPLQGELWRQGFELVLVTWEGNEITLSVSKNINNIFLSMSIRSFFMHC